MELQTRYDTGRFVPSFRHVGVARRRAPQNMGLGGWIGLTEPKSILGLPNPATSYIETCGGPPAHFSHFLPVDWLTGFVVKGQEVTGLPTLLVSAMCILLRWGLDT